MYTSNFVLKNQRTGCKNDITFSDAVMLERFADMENDIKKLVFKTIKQMASTNHQYTGDKCIKHDLGVLAFDDKSMKEVGTQYYIRLTHKLVFYF